jgi:Fic family protein
MIFSAPVLPPDFVKVLENIDELRKTLKFMTSDSIHRWQGYVARMAYARAIHASNAIEGIKVSLDDAVAAVDREEPLKPQDEHWHALVGYREAMDYIIQLANDPSFQYNSGTILGLHYMMMKYDLTKYPGRWRPGDINVINDQTGEVVYEGPEGKIVPQLMDELLTNLNARDSSHVIVRAAMAHLNMAMIHPFKDGNGRMARAIQTMALAREGILSPVFSSIEEYVGRNSQNYYAALAEVGRGKWHPENDALPWIRFCLTAHNYQAQTLLRRVTEMGKLIESFETEIKKRKLNDRVINALVDAALGLSVKNPTYRKQAEISDQLAKIDLLSLVNSGFLVAKGERRWRHYVASDELKALREKARIPDEIIDPFTKVENENAMKQQQLPGLEQT